MKLTLLVDLDDTLLANNMEVFEPAYLKALSKHLSGHIKPEIMLRELIKATQSMIKNDYPALTLEKVFDQAFYPAAGISKDKLKGAISSFYEDEFPKLISVTSAKQDAQFFINWAISKGHLLVVATNPLFPWTAIYQRLEWAGFPPARFPFQLISTYESFHFSKPNVSYYAEILAQLGWPAEPIIMIGNDYKDDILPAKRLGLNTFWVHRPASGSSNTELDSAQKSGNFYDLVSWLDSSLDPPIYHLCSDREALVAILSANLAALQTLTEDSLFNGRDLSTQLQFKRFMKNWSDVENRKYLAELKLALQSTKIPDLPESTMDNFPLKTQNTSHSPEAMDGLFTTRLFALDLLKGLPSRYWDQNLTFKVFGAQPLSSYVEQWAAHDRAMLQDFRKLVGETSY